MRKLSILMLAVAVLGLAAIALPARAQDIMGLSFRPTDKLPDAGSGIIDLKAQPEANTFKVTVDLSKAADALKLDQFKGAKGVVIWAVDMDGYWHNLGMLSDKAVLEEADAKFIVAKLFATAEPDTAASSPTTDRLYEVTLRNVDEKKSAPPAAAKDVEQPKPTEAAKTDAGSSTTAVTATSGTTTTAASADKKVDTTSKPATLPTTGTPLVDLSLLAALAAILVLGGWQVRRVRV